MCLRTLIIWPEAICSIVGARNFGPASPHLSALVVSGMPPRRKAPNTKAASVAVVVVAPVAKPQQHANEATPKKLVDDLSEMPSSSNKRRLERRDTDDKSDRDIQRHFPHLIAQQVDSMTNAEGESLRGEINTAIRN